MYIAQAYEEYPQLSRYMKMVGKVTFFHIPLDVLGDLIEAMYLKGKNDGEAAHAKHIDDTYLIG